MRLYSLHKRQFVTVFILFFLCLFITIFIGIVGPSIIQSIDYKFKNPAKQLVKLIELTIYFNQFILTSLVLMKYNLNILIDFINDVG